MAPNQSPDHHVVAAQQCSSGIHSPFFLLIEVDQNDLHSSALPVKVSCDLVSLKLLVAPHSTDDDG